jgi:hypothetical protein
MISWIGWVATAVFAVSYFCRQPKMLRIVQAIAALMWVTYGFLIGAMPCVFTAYSLHASLYGNSVRRCANCNPL